MSFDKHTKRYFLLHLNSLNILRVKRAEQFRIPGAWFIFVLLDVEETICPVVEHHGDDERAFPSGGELVWLLLIHSEDQVPFLERMTSYVPGMELMQVLLINGQPDQGHLSFFLQEVDCILSSLLCFLF